MAVTQTQYGKAYEYACLISLEQSVKPVRPVTIIDSSSLKVAKNYWESLPAEIRKTMAASSLAGAKALISMEPKIIEDGKDVLELSLQPDQRGQEGDVRDLLVIRRSIKWEIGISIKHNHTAVKHSRLSQSINFGKDWFGLDCSKEYFNEIEPIFSMLKEQASLKRKWSDLTDKTDLVYKPLLIAFRTELLRLDVANPGVVPSKLLEYLLGRKDFYKIISNDTQHYTKVQCFNLHGTLNKASATQAPLLKANHLRMPSKIYYFDMKQVTEGDSNTTLQLVMDEDWGVSFRIHNASTTVEPSLKFDIQVTGVPSNLFAQHVQWRKI